jgi:hypothetical protein
MNSSKEKTSGNEGCKKKSSHKTFSTHVTIVQTKRALVPLTSVTHKKIVHVMMEAQTTIAHATHHTRSVGIGVAVQTW